MGRPKKNPEAVEATPSVKKEKKSFDAFWEKYESKNIFNASDREKQIARDAAEAAWNEK